MKILLVVYNNDSYIHTTPLGLMYIAATLKKHGYEVEIYNQDLHNYTDAHLTDYISKNRFDVVGYSTIGGYYQYRKLLNISEAINRSTPRPFYIIGGHGPSPEPEYFLNKTQADVVVIGEGEETILELLNAVSNHQSLKNIKGIAYRDGDKTIVNPRRELIKDLDNIPIPAYELFPIEYYRLLRYPHCNSSDFSMSMLSGRGCVFKCNFCYRLDEGFRARSSDAIIEEISFLQHRHNINYIAFVDELLMSSVARTEELCNAFINAKLNFKWFCNGRLNFAKPDLLKLMKKAGCVFINYGIESFDDQILKNMNKCLTTKQIIVGIEATLDVGISPGFNVIFGNIGENKKTLEQGVNLLLKYDDGAQLRTIRPVTPYPGSPLYYYAIEKGLIKDCDDFYKNKHTNSDLLTANFTELSDEDFYSALCDANIKLVDNFYSKKKDAYLKEIKHLYGTKDASFRGFRQT